MLLGSCEEAEPIIITHTSASEALQGVECILVADAHIYVGAANGILSVWAVPPPILSTVPPDDFTVPVKYLLTIRRASAGQPISQLQALPAVGLLTYNCGGAVIACTLKELRHVATLHHARATRFHSDAAAPVACLCVCAGHSLVVFYELCVPVRMRWKRVLKDRTTAIHVGQGHVAVATTTSCQLRCARTGEVRQAIELWVTSPSSASVWGLASFVAHPHTRSVWLLPVAQLRSPTAGAGVGVDAAAPQSPRMGAVVDSVLVFSLDASELNVMRLDACDPSAAALLGGSSTQLAPSAYGHVVSFLTGQLHLTAARAVLPTEAEWMEWRRSGQGVNSQLSDQGVNSQLSGRGPLALRCEALAPAVVAPSRALSPERPACFCLCGLHAFVASGAQLWRLPLVGEQPDARQLHDELMACSARRDLDSARLECSARRDLDSDRLECSARRDLDSARLECSARRGSTSCSGAGADGSSGSDSGSGSGSISGSGSGSSSISGSGVLALMDGTRPVPTGDAALASRPVPTGDAALASRPVPTGDAALASRLLECASHPLGTALAALLCTVRTADSEAARAHASLAFGDLAFGDRDCSRVRRGAELARASVASEHQRHEPAALKARVTSLLEIDRCGDARGTAAIAISQREMATSKREMDISQRELSLAYAELQVSEALAAVVAACVGVADTLGEQRRMMVSSAVSSQPRGDRTEPFDEGLVALAETLVYGPELHASLLLMLSHRHAYAHALLREGAHAMLEGARTRMSTSGLAEHRRERIASALCAPGGPRGAWQRLCSERRPSLKLRAIADACDAIVAAAATATAQEAEEVQKGAKEGAKEGVVNADELLPMVAYSLADALVVAGVADELLSHLTLAEAHLPASEASFKLGYCLTTVQAAVRCVTEAAPAASQKQSGIGATDSERGGDGGAVQKKAVS